MLDSKTKLDKFRKLSILSLVTGILPYKFTTAMPFIVEPESPIFPLITNFLALIIFSYIGIMFCLTITAIVSRSIDLARVLKGLNSKKGTGLDFSGFNWDLIYNLGANWFSAIPSMIVKRGNQISFF